MRTITSKVMAGLENVQSALRALEEGDFDHAYDLYGRLVELFPENPEYACGFYSSGYWRNRQDNIEAEAAGRARGTYLFTEWDRFARVSEEKEFESCLSYRAVMQWVLGTAAAELRGAFHSEGGRGVDADLLIDLSVCLIRIEDYSNAADILRYTARLHPQNARVQFLLGEALCSSGDDSQTARGLTLYRDALWMDPASADATLISSEPASTVFRALFEEMQQNLERTTDWFPAYLSAKSFAFQVKAIPEKAAQAWSDEYSRLQASLKSVVEKYRDRVRSRMAFILLELLRCAHQVSDHASIQEAEELLKNLAPEPYAAYRESRKAR